jgi:hypothetical protein
MIEILENLEILRQPVLDLSELQLDGVSYGMSTATFPRHKIRDVMFSPIVWNSRGGTDKKPEYFDATGRQLSLNELIDSVIDSNGIFHCENSIAFKIASGRIVGFGVYGVHLRHFDYLDTYEKFASAFPGADSIIRDEDDGLLWRCDHYYYGSRKHVTWNATFRVGIAHINLGEFPGNHPDYKSDPVIRNKLDWKFTTHFICALDGKSKLPEITQGLLADDEWQQISQLLFKRNPLQAVINIKKWSGLGLKEAGDLMYDLYNELRRDHPEKFEVSEEEYWKGWYS